MAYATVADLQARMTRTLSAAEQNVAATLLDDAAVMIDAVAKEADAGAKKIVSCRMVTRALGDGSDSSSVPVGASQGSMSGLGYSQSWTIGSGGTTGEMYISKSDRSILRAGNAIGSYSPVQELVPVPPVPVFDPDPQPEAEGET